MVRKLYSQVAGATTGNELAEAGRPDLGGRSAVQSDADRRARLC
jgi:hypothetical protein